MENFNSFTPILSGHPSETLGAAKIPCCQSRCCRNKSRCCVHWTCKSWARSRSQTPDHLQSDSSYFEESNLATGRAAYRRVNFANEQSAFHRSFRQTRSTETPRPGLPQPKPSTSTRFHSTANRRFETVLNENRNLSPLLYCK